MVSSSLHSETRRKKIREVMRFSLKSDLDQDQGRPFYALITPGGGEVNAYGTLSLFLYLLLRVQHIEYKNNEHYLPTE